MGYLLCLAERCLGDGLFEFRGWISRFLRNFGFTSILMVPALHILWLDTSLETPSDTTPHLQPNPKETSQPNNLGKPTSQSAIPAKARI